MLIELIALAVKLPGAAGMPEGVVTEIGWEATDSLRS
jgi:hypothetical protein